jgi:hypothetical protein
MGAPSIGHQLVCGFLLRIDLCLHGVGIVLHTQRSTPQEVNGTPYGEVSHSRLTHWWGREGTAGGVAHPLVAHTHTIGCRQSTGLPLDSA